MPSPSEWSSCSARISPARVSRSTTSPSTPRPSRPGSSSSPTATPPWIWTPSPNCPARRVGATRRPARRRGQLRAEGQLARGRPSVDHRKHFRRARGRKVELQLADGTGLTGRIGDVDGGALRLITRVRSDWAVRQIPLADIAKAVVQVEFFNSRCVSWNCWVKPERRPEHEYRHGRIARHRVDRGSPRENSSTPSSQRC